MHRRHITHLLEEALQDTPVVLLNGARQTGKSTLTQSLSDGTNRRYLTLDNQTVLAAAKNDPEGFVAGLNGPVVLDEIQRAPELFLVIKAAVDQNRQPGQFLLTGSANILLLPVLADSLAGRIEILSLWPFSAAELAGKPTDNRADFLFDGQITNLSGLLNTPIDRPAFVEKLLAGGYPEAVSRTTPRRRSAWFESYLVTILQRDVRELAQLEQLAEMPRLLQLLATRSATLLNFAELSRSSGLSQTTLKRYFNLLETLFMVVRVPAWERNPGKRLVKTPKVYLPDSGLLAHQLMFSQEGLNKNAGLPGNLAETFVLGELLKHLAFTEKRLTLWHYRTQSDIEVDFLLENPLGKITGIEVKASQSVDGKDFKGLRHLQETESEKFQQGIVLYTGNEVIPFGEKLFAVPMSVWWN